LSARVLTKILKTAYYGLDQQCPTLGALAAYGPVESFVRPSLGCCYGKSILYSENLSLFW